MEIVKPGKVTLLEQECPECGCVFRYNTSVDVVLVWSHKGIPTADGHPRRGTDGTVEMTTCVRCPCCNKMLPTADCKPEGSFLL